MKFEVGKQYDNARYNIVTVIKRTAKMVVVRDESGHQYKMKVRLDKDGNEYMFDSALPVKWRDEFKFSAKWEV